MTLRFAEDALLYADLVPQAEVEMSGNELQLLELCDDLDDFTGRAFRVGDLTFTVKHYKHNQPNIFTIYFERNDNPAEISAHVETIVESLGLPRAALRWDRSRNPTY